MNWSTVLSKPELQNLPYKIELNNSGSIVMSPVKFLHSCYQAEIVAQLNLCLSGGRAGFETALKTSDNTKVPDVVWMSFAFIRANLEFDELPSAPEICIEVISPSNSLREMRQKGKLYFEAGAKEYWLCDLNGKMRFFDAKGQLQGSRIAPSFPLEIDIAQQLQ
jgi:Uma2 family endonuclease